MQPLPQQANDAFDETSKDGKVPSWAEFDPLTIETEKLHAILRYEAQVSKGAVLPLAQIWSFQKFIENTAEFAQEHPEVKFVVIDEEKNFIMVSGVDGLEDEISEAIPRLFLGADVQEADDEKRKEMSNLFTVTGIPGLALKAGLIKLKQTEQAMQELEDRDISSPPTLAS